MNEGQEAQISSQSIIKVAVIFTVAVLLLTYCSARLNRPPSRSFTDLSPRARAQLLSDILEANPDTPGEQFKLADLTQAGKYTVVEFYSLFSPECLEIEPKLELLAKARMDMAIRRLNIDRPDKREIDWQSPLAKQYQLQKLPTFMLFDPDEKLIAKGDQARREIDLSLLTDLKKRPH